MDCCHGQVIVLCRGTEVCMSVPGANISQELRLINQWPDFFIFRYYFTILSILSIARTTATNTYPTQK